jgi:hypothetical protein
MSRERMDTEEFAAMVAAPLKSKLELSDDFDARVMAAVAASQAPWWKRSVQLSITPLRALAIAAGLGALMALPSTGLLNSTSPATASAARVDTLHLVRFVVAVPGAQTVSLAGDFNGWSRTLTPLADEDGSGQWSVTLPLMPGRHEYAFVVDGERWMADPYAAAARDEFGQVSSILRVGSEPVRGS